MANVYARPNYKPLGAQGVLTVQAQRDCIECEMQQVGSGFNGFGPRLDVPLVSLDAPVAISLGAQVLPGIGAILGRLSYQGNSAGHLILLAPDLSRDAFQPTESQISSGVQLLCPGFALSRLWTKITVLYCSGRPIQGYTQPNPSSFEKLGSAGPSHWLDESKHQVLQNVYAFDVAPLVDVYSDCLHAMLCSPEFLGALGALVRSGRFPVEMVQRRAAVTAKPAAG